MRTAIVILCVMTATLSGCATVQKPDPLESMNRKTFAFNKKLDKAVIRPVAKGYQKVVPARVRASVSNFFANPLDLWSATSLFLQGRPADGMSDVMRVGTNTTIGVLGLFDVATYLGFEKHGEDFGQVLGHWGMGPGAYIVWPLFGPSTARDTTALVSEIALTPQLFVSDTALYNTLTALQVVSIRSDLLTATDIIDERALDPYLSTRDAYLQRRRTLVYNGNPPPLSEDVEAEFNDDFQARDFQPNDFQPEGKQDDNTTP